ncbi:MULTISPECIES: PIN domain-containing protein [Citricoccus]|uniref:PIN domain-containing protein n=2 Tax=Citricoccus TaxID=169133 RepID=A0ABV6F0J7_9MICC|nr:MULTISPECIES: PIN domain-containing protein [Citricoccus]
METTGIFSLAEEDEHLADAVVVDTNLFWGDLHLRGGTWKRLVNLQRSRVVRLYFPEVVVREMVRHYQRRHRENMNLIINAVDNPVDLDNVLIDLGLSSPGVSKKDLRSRRDAALSSGVYEDSLRRQITSVGEVLDLPPINPEDLIDSYLRAKKPFKTDDAGIADYVIWQTVRSLAVSEPRRSIILLTKNHKDFASGGTLHPDLRVTLNEADQVAVCIDVENFLAEYEEEVRLAEEGQTYFAPAAKDLAMDAAEDYVENHLVGAKVAGSDFDPYPSGLEIDGLVLPSEIESPHISWVALEVDSASWDPYEAFENTMELGQLECRAEVNISAHVHRSEAYSLEQSGEVDAVDLGNLEEHYVEVDLTRHVVLQFNIRVDKEMSGQVEHLDKIAID